MNYNEKAIKTILGKKKVLKQVINDALSNLEYDEDSQFEEVKFAENQKLYAQLQTDLSVAAQDAVAGNSATSQAAGLSKAFKI